MKKVIIMRGISGAGKSTHTKNNYPDAFVCSADHHFIDADGNYNFNPDELRNAHKQCLLRFMDQVVAGYFETIVVDNTNTQLWELSPYVAIAEAHGCEVKLVHVKCDVEVAAARNTHGVPRKSVKSMERRFQRPLPWWNQEEVG